MFLDSRQRAWQVARMISVVGRLYRGTQQRIKNLLYVYLSAGRCIEDEYKILWDSQ
jgi:hypothetical protein